MATTPDPKLVAQGSKLEATTAPATPAQHTARMVASLKHAKFGRYSGSDSFVKQMTSNSANNVTLTPRQQWWLTSLVVRYRKQLKLPSEIEALAMAQQWLRENPEPINAAESHEPRAASSGSTVPAASKLEAQGSKLVAAPDQPELF